MKAVLGPSRRRSVAIFSIFFVVSVLLTAGMTCDNTYQLIISSTSGGSVTIPGEDTRNYDAGTVVELLATPDEGYEFRGWTGDTEHIADPDSASTVITMNGNYSISATFGENGDGGGGPISPLVRCAGPRPSKPAS